MDGSAHLEKRSLVVAPSGPPPEELYENYQGIHYHPHRKYCTLIPSSNLFCNRFLNFMQDSEFQM